MNTPSTYFDGIDTHIPTASGGAIHNVDGYVVHEFTASTATSQTTHTFTPAKTVNYQFFMVGNGQGGGIGTSPTNKGGGGGGGGEVVIGSITLQSGSNYTVAIGVDGGYNIGIKEGASYLVQAYNGGGGGRGGASTYEQADGEDGDTGGAGTGGSGGGAAVAAGTNYDRTGGESFAANTYLNYILRYGNDGGNTRVDLGSGTQAAGGGGAGSEGGDANVGVGGSGKGGDGGGGIANTWLGSTLYYGGGGGGYPAGVGNGGGGNAAVTANGSAVSPRQWSGAGGGGEYTPGTSNNGGARGCVLIRYKTDV